MRLTHIFFILFFCLILSSLSHAGEALMRRQQMIQQQRQQYQQQMQQRALQQRALQQQAAQRQAIQRQRAALQQRQLQVQHQQRAYQQAMLQKRAQQQAARVQQQAHQQAQQFQQAQQQAARQIQQSAKQQMQQLLAQQQRQQEAQQQQLQQTMNTMNQSAVNDMNNLNSLNSWADQPPPVKEIVNMKQVLEDLKISSELWPMIIDDRSKQLVVASFMENYRQDGVAIRKPPAFYVDVIDSMSMQNPDLLHNPFSDILKMVAIIEYDFDNGVDKDLLARQVLGNKAYKANKKRLGK